MQNAYYCWPILARLGVGSVKLVTSEFHLPRSRYLFEATFAALAASEGRPSPLLEGHPAPTPPPAKEDKAINAMTVAERLEQERVFISEKIVPRFLPTHIPGFPVAPLSDVRLQQALAEVESLLSACRAKR
eukprot:CAMPEP_0177744878 /NCGR_PEP_ID=MMETSP0484_2-20121128/30000_1 /TAXON_ID=354590 /ORGANISM="Rhodomonas lens, Strain RHODO" /LENGTH=130 /DNA_ID=CAMNT_0019259449 /DNA_START=161 /DNA_END=553 /DNA_ORIENTATION=-